MKQPLQQKIETNGVHMQFEEPSYREKIISITFQERVI
jgi:hypothetical protein